MVLDFTFHALTCFALLMVFVAHRRIDILEGRLRGDTPEVPQ